LRRDQQQSRANAAGGDGGDTYGDLIREWSKEIFHIGLLNSEGLGQFHGHIKLEEVCKLIIWKGLDVLGLTEVNLHWKLLEPKHRIHEHIQGWFRSTHVSYSYFENYPNPRKYQPGGTVILSRNEAADRVMGSGKDTELGRWSWTQY
jgi:hypothetical protein